MRNILKIIKISRSLYHLVAVLALLILAGAFFELVVPILSKFIVDEIVAKLKGTGGDLNRLIFLIALTFGLSVLGIILSALSERLGDHFGGRLRKFLTEKFYNKVLTLPQSYFDSEVSGKIVNQLNRGITTIQDFINTATNFILPIFLQTILTIIILAHYNMPVAFFTFLLFPVYLAISYYSAKKWGVEEVRKNKIEDSTRGRIQEVIGNMKLVKSFTAEEKEYDIVSQNLTDINEIYARQSQAFHFYDFLRNFSLVMVLTIVNIIVFINAFQGRMTLGEMVLILQLINQARRPLFAMSFILEQVQRADSGSQEFFELISLPSVEQYRAPKKVPRLNQPTIEFRRVSFKYDRSVEVLKDISFTLTPKEKVALVGHSGVGKTTIINLILKLYNPTAGQIFWSKKNYSLLSHTDIRANIALVFQENELFSTTVRENVAYGTSGASESAIIAALEKANAYDFVRQLPKKLDAQIGERGVRLSGGQKQRIQIARAILKDAPLLILDEATSSLDSRSEREVQLGLANLMKDRLVIIVAHRFSTIQDVDKIIVIDGGLVVDCGSPKELSTRPGIYRDLLTYQVEGNKKLLEQFELY